MGDNWTIQVYLENSRYSGAYVMFRVQRPVQCKQQTDYLKSSVKFTVLTTSNTVFHVSVSLLSC